MQSQSILSAGPEVVHKGSRAKVGTQEATKEGHLGFHKPGIAWVSQTLRSLWILLLELAKPLLTSVPEFQLLGAFPKSFFLPVSGL